MNLFRCANTLNPLVRWLSGLFALWLVLPEDRYGFLAYVVTVSESWQGVYTLAQIFRHPFELDDIDKENFSFLIIVHNRSQVGVILVIWNRVPWDVIDPHYFIGPGILINSGLLW